MADTQTQLRKGSTAQIAAFTGVLAEISFDTTLNRVVGHDGVLAGGYPLAALHLAQTFPLTQTFSAAINNFGLAANATNKIQFSDVAAAGTNTLDFGTGGTTDFNFIRKYFASPFAVEVASSGFLDFVIDSNNTATGDSFRFLTNGVNGAGTLLFTINDNGSLVATGALNMGTNLINNVVNPVAAQDAATKSYVDAGVAGATPPFIDTTALVKGSADATKLMRFEVDGFTAATTRVLTPPNADITLAGINIAQTFAAAQTFSPAVNTSAIVVSGFSLTGANAQSAIDVSGTWNTSGVPTALKVNITDTASGGSSLLMDLQIGGVSQASVSKTGLLDANAAYIAGTLTVDGLASFGLGDTEIDTTGVTVGINTVATPTYLNANGAVTAGNGLFSITATTGVLQLANGTDPAADPTDATTQWAVGGEWQYRSSAASEGAGQTNRVHNRAAIVDGDGTNYTLTTSYARVDFGTTDPEIVLPTAGTYIIHATITFTSSALAAADFHAAVLRNSTDAVFVGEAAAITLGASFTSSISIMRIYSVTASKTIQVWATNLTAARGIVGAAVTNIKYARLY